LREIETTSVNVYKSGTVIVQGILMQFQQDLYAIKERALQEKLSLCDDFPILGESDHTSSNCPADEDTPPPQH
jgi:ribonuclease HIII